MTVQAPALPSGPTPLEIGMLPYPDTMLLDLAGPQAALGMHGRTPLFWKTLDPVTTDTGVALLPTAAFADAPARLDVLFVPRGVGTVAAMRDKGIVAFLAERGRDARYVTSVCTGSLLLGKAGLLDGDRAATHRACYEALEALAVQPGRERVIADRNRFTGGGVTAGIDFGLALLAELRGEEVAKTTQLIIEYGPAPPFNVGRPRSAGPELTAAALRVMGNMGEEAVEVAKTRREREPA